MEEQKVDTDKMSLSSIAKRATSKSPDFFVTLQNICGVITVVGGALLAIPGITPIIGTIVIVAGAVGAGVAKLTKKP